MTGEEKRLFEAFVELRKADNVSPEQGPVPGIGPRTLRRYIVDGEVPSRLEPATTAAMARFMTSRGDTRFEEFAVVDVPTPTGTRSDLARQIDEIRRGPGTMSEKGRLIAEVSAAYRAVAWADEAVGAKERGVAGRIEAEKAPNRTLPADLNSEQMGLVVRALRAWLALHSDGEDVGPSNGGPEPPHPPPPGE